MPLTKWRRDTRKNEIFRVFSLYQFDYFVFCKPSNPEIMLIRASDGVTQTFKLYPMTIILDNLSNLGN